MGDKRSRRDFLSLAVLGGAGLLISCRGSGSSSSAVAPNNLESLRAKPTPTVIPTVVAAAALTKATVVTAKGTPTPVPTTVSQLAPEIRKGLDFLLSRQRESGLIGYEETTLVAVEVFLKNGFRLEEVRKSGGQSLLEAAHRFAQGSKKALDRALVVIHAPHFFTTWWSDEEIQELIKNDLGGSANVWRASKLLGENNTSQMERLQKTIPNLVDLGKPESLALARMAGITVSVSAKLRRGDGSYEQPQGLDILSSTCFCAVAFGLDEGAKNFIISRQREDGSFQPSVENGEAGVILTTAWSLLALNG